MNHMSDFHPLFAGNVAWNNLLPNKFQYTLDEWVLVGGKNSIFAASSSLYLWQTHFFIFYIVLSLNNEQEAKIIVVNTHFASNC